MIESLEDLRRICQKPHYKDEGNWMARHITRDMALPITRILLHFPVSANQVTTFSIGVILAAAFFFGKGTPVSIFFGVFLFQFWYLLDHVDGQVARYRKQASSTGIFYDFISHHIVNLSILSSLGYGLSLHSGEQDALIGGFIGACSITLFHVIYESQYKACFAAFTKKARELPGGQLNVSVSSAANGGTTAPKAASAAKKIYSLMHKLCEVHVLMNLLTLVSIVSWLADDLSSLRLFVLYYAFSAPLLFVLKIRHMLKTKAVDAQIAEYLEK